MTEKSPRLPNLFLVGAMKSATTSMHSYLDLHPEIFMTKAPFKEPAFFVEELRWNKGIDWYLSLFQSAENQKYRGESSTDYTKAPNYAGVPERIHAVCPDAKIIYVMRDPIERAISQYWWEVEFSFEGRRMPEAILKNDWILNASNYAMQIKPYLKLFGRKNVFTVSTETLISDTDGTLNAVFSWLGITTDIDFPEHFSVFNKSAIHVNRFSGAGLISHLKGTAFWLWLKKNINPKLKKKLSKTLSRKVEKDNTYRNETIAILKPIIRPQAEELSAVLGRQFPEWTTLYGDS